MSVSAMTELLASAWQKYGRRTSVVDSAGSHTYDDLIDASSRVAAALLDGRDDLQEERVAFWVAPGFLGLLKNR